MLKKLGFIITGLFIGSYFQGNASESEKENLLLPKPINPSSNVLKEGIKGDAIDQKKERVEQEDVFPSKIQLHNQRILEVHLSKELKERLLEERLSGTPGTFTKEFDQLFKDAQSLRVSDMVSDRVIGFYFKIDTKDKVRRNTFLGENAS